MLDILDFDEISQILHSEFVNFSNKTKEELKNVVVLLKRSCFLSLEGYNVFHDIKHSGGGVMSYGGDLIPPPPCFY